MSEEESDHTRIKVTVKIGDFQVELEGPNNTIQNLMNNSLFNFIQGLQDTLAGVDLKPNEVIQEGDIIKIEEFPPQIGKTESLVEALRKLTDMDWGKKPRTLDDYMNVLEINGLYYSKAVVSRTLLTMVKNAELRRLGKRGSYRYVSS